MQCPRSKLLVKARHHSAAIVHMLPLPHSLALPLSLSLSVRLLVVCQGEHPLLGGHHHGAGVALPGACCTSGAAVLVVHELGLHNIL